MIKEFFKNYLLQPLCYVGIVLLALFILNQFAYFNFSLGSNNNTNSFEVIGVGKVSATPKNAGTTFTINQKGATQKEAKDKANTIQNQAIAALTSLGISKSNIKTIGFNVNPNYEPDENSNQFMPPTRQTQNGYVAIITTQIKDSSVDQINQAIDQLTALGMNVGGVEYGTQNSSELVNEAQAKAIEDAKKQAQNLAKAAGFTVGKIITIRNADDQQYQPYAANMSLKAAPDESTSLEPGQNEITARMGVTFYIK